MIDFLKKNPIYICFVGCFILFLSLFFPLIEKEVFWVKQNPTLLSLDGKWIILLLFLALTFIIYKKEKYALIPFLANLLLFTKDVKAILPTFKPNQLLQSFSYGLGFYLFILGCICIALYYMLVFYLASQRKKMDTKKHTVRKKYHKQESK